MIYCIGIVKNYEIVAFYFNLTSKTRERKKKKKDIFFFQAHGDIEI